VWTLGIVVSIWLGLIFIFLIIISSKLTRAAKLRASLILGVAFLFNTGYYIFAWENILFDLINKKQYNIAYIILGSNYDAKKLLDKAFEADNLELAHIILNDRKQLQYIIFDYIKTNNQKSVTKMSISGLTPDIRDGDGYTPLHRLAEKGDTEGAKALMSSEPNLLLKTNGMTALDMAIKQGRNNFAKLLIEMGASTLSETIIDDTSSQKEIYQLAQKFGYRSNQQSPLMLEHIYQTAPTNLTGLTEHYWRKGCIRRHTDIIFGLGWGTKEVFQFNEFTVSGEKTHLQWMLCPMGMTFSHQSQKCTGKAKVYDIHGVQDTITKLNERSLFGFNDWRLPSIRDIEPFYYIKQQIGGVRYLRLLKGLEYISDAPHFWLSPCVKTLVNGYKYPTTYCMHCCSLSEAGRPSLLGSSLNKQASGNHDKFSLLLVRSTSTQSQRNRPANSTVPPFINSQ